MIGLMLRCNRDPGMLLPSGSEYALCIYPSDIVLTPPCSLNGSNISAGVFLSKPLSDCHPQPCTRAQRNVPFGGSPSQHGHRIHID